MSNTIARALVIAAALTTATAQSASGFGLLPAGGELQVNTFTALDEGSPSVAVDANGNSVVVWGSDEIFGQRYASDGSPLGSEFQVNTTMSGFQGSADVAFAPNGDFIVVWMLNNDVVGQRFSSSGAALGTEFAVNVPAPGFQGSPGIVAGTAGGFVVVWADVSGQDGSGFGIFGRRFDSSANPVSGQFQVNTHTPGNQAFQFRGAIAADASGTFVVAWQGYLQDGELDGVFAQRFTELNARIGSEFQVNTTTISWQRSPQVAAAADGDFVVSWISYEQDGYHTGIFTQRFASSGAPLGTEMQVNTYTVGSQGFPVMDVAATANGDFLVVWESGQGQDGSEFGVFGKLISSSGEAATAEFQINTYTLDDQDFPVVGASPDGNFVVAWESYGQDGAASYGVFSRRLVPAPDCLPAPVAGCRTAEKSLLLMKQPSSGKDKLIWKLVKGDATEQEDFGDPTADTDYALCIYAGTANALINEVNVPADSSKWEPLGTKGFKYNDLNKTADGVQKVLLSGGTQGRMKAKLKGKDANLPDPTLGSLPAPVTAQLVRSGSLDCWEATYQSGDVIDNDTDSFKAKFSN